jgi:hypothetical protein
LFFPTRPGGKVDGLTIHAGNSLAAMLATSNPPPDIVVGAAGAGPPQARSRHDAAMSGAVWSTGHLLAFFPKNAHVAELADMAA